MLYELLDIMGWGKEPLFAFPFPVQRGERLHVVANQQFVRRPKLLFPSRPLQLGAAHNLRPNLPTPYVATLDVFRVEVHILLSTTVRLTHFGPLRNLSISESCAGI